MLGLGAVGPGNSVSKLRLRTRHATGQISRDRLTRRHLVDLVRGFVLSAPGSPWRLLRRRGVMSDLHSGRVQKTVSAEQSVTALV